MDSNDPRLQQLTAVLAPQGVVGVAVPDWNDKSTWTIWYEGSAELNAAEDPRAGAIVAAFDPKAPLPVSSILSQDLMAQFTADDAARIQAAVAGNAQFWLLWSAMQSQKDPMLVTNARFLTGWAALVQVLGTDRMAAIAAALNVTIG